jgi:hypothetical protein
MAHRMDGGLQLLLAIAVFLFAVIVRIFKKMMK